MHLSTADLAPQLQPRTLRFLAAIREATFDHTRADPPRHDLARSLLAAWERDCPGAPALDDEAVRSAIRLGCGT